MGKSDGWRGKEKRKEERGNRREERLWIWKDGGTLLAMSRHIIDMSLDSLDCFSVPPEAPTPYGP